MARKCIALFVLAAFSLFNFSCISPSVRQEIAMDPAKIDRGDASLKIASVFTKKGTTVEFQKGAPARIVADSDPPVISGRALQYFSIDKNKVKSLVKNSQGHTTIKTLDGQVYNVVSSVIKEDHGKLEFSAYGPVTIPLSDIQRLWILGRSRSSDSTQLLPAAGQETGMDPAKLNMGDTSLKIVAVVTKEGKTVEFQKDAPAGVVAGSDPPVISGRALQHFSIDKDKVKSSAKNKKGQTIIKTLDGRVYTVVSSVIKEDLGKLEFSAYGPVAMPVSNIQRVWILKSRPSSVLTPILLVVGLVCTVLIVLGFDKLSSDMDELDSCPFVYSYDGEKYVLDAEPYGGAVSEGLKRTDWVELPHLRAVDGKYRLLLTNELDETQFTDELKLVAVDHAPGVEVAPGLDGRLHTFSRPQAPTRAADRDGRDILAFVAANDRVFWVGDIEGRDPDEAGDFRDELVFEFPKPAGAARAKLLANVWTTMWGSSSAGRYLELYGSSLEEAYRDVDRGGPMYHLFQSWMDREELYRLKIWVETPAGWKERGAIWGGAPVVTQDKAYLVDVSDVAGETLRIKLRPPVNFWMVNSLAVDYGEDKPVQVTELAAGRAVDHTGRDVRRELEATDGLYYVSPNPGERTELEFAAPPVPEGLERTVLVKASGYYKAHIDTTGGPQTALIVRVLGEPGFAARYSFRKYLEWEAAILAEAARR